MTQSLRHNTNTASGWWPVFAAAVLAYSGMLTEYAQRLWSRDYFQFYPVFLVAVIAITIDRIRDAEFPEARSWRIEPIAGGFGVCLLLASCWFWSPWLATVSLLLLGDSLMCGLPMARSSWRLLALLVALPLGLDRQLVHSLQQLSSVRASQVLDRLNVPHLMSGNVLELADKRLFVEEACSGISSFYLLLAVTAVYIVMNHTRWIKAIPLLLSVGWWAVVANIMRIVGIAAAHYFWQFDLTTGWPHEVVGIVILLLALAGLFSTGCLLNLIFGAIRSDSTQQQSGSLILTPTELWEVFTRKKRASELSAVSSFTLKLPRGKMLNTLAVLLLASGAYYWGTVAHAAMRANRPETPNATTRETLSSDVLMTPLDRLNQTTFAAIADLNITEFHAATRIEHRQGPYEKRSSQWEVATSFGKGRVAIEGPFTSWNDLRIHYEQLGWKFELTTVHRIRGQRPGSNLVTVRMINPSARRAHLHFCLFAAAGDLLHAPIADSQSSLAAQLRNQFAAKDSAQSAAHWWQLQLLIESPGQSLDFEIAAEQHLFAELLQVVQAHWKSRSQ